MENKYEVWLRNKRTGNRRSIILWASSFREAEELVISGAFTRERNVITKDEEIIQIDKAYSDIQNDREVASLDSYDKMLLEIEPEQRR